MIARIKAYGWQLLVLALAGLLLWQTLRLAGAEVAEAKAQQALSTHVATQAQAGQAETTKKAGALLTPGRNRRTPMPTSKTYSAWKLPALLMLAALQACSTTSAPPPPVTPKLQPTPLPREISQISTSSSQPVLQKAREWLENLSAWSKSEIPR